MVILMLGLVAVAVVKYRYFNQPPPEQIIGSPEFFGWLVGMELVVGEPVYQCSHWIFPPDGASIRVFKLPPTATYYFCSSDFAQHHPTRPFFDRFTFHAWKRGSLSWKDDESVENGLFAINFALEGGCEGDPLWADVWRGLHAIIESPMNYYASESDRRNNDLYVYLLDLENGLFIVYEHDF